MRHVIQEGVAVTNAMAAPLIGDTPMTNAQRQARWRERHAKKLARKAARRGGHTVANIQDLCDLVPTLEDWAALFAGGVKASAEAPRATSKPSHRRHITKTHNKCDTSSLRHRRW